MCGIAAAGLALSAFGTVTSFISSQNQAAQANYQADIATQDARNEKSYAQIRADKIRKAGLLKQSEARVSLAGSGVDVDAGTSVEINRKIGENTEQDALTEILDGNNRAAKLDQQAQGYKIQAAGSKLSGLGTLIAGGAQTLQGWRTINDSTKVNA